MPIIDKIYINGGFLLKDPLHNALAERMNNTIKNGWFFNEGNLDFEQARQ